MESFSNALLAYGGSHIAKNFFSVVTVPGDCVLCFKINMFYLWYGVWEIRLSLFYNRFLMLNDSDKNI